MSKKYKEIMDQVRVTDEMKQRILQNVKEEMESEKMPESGKIIRSRFLSYGRTSRYLSAAACIMMLIVGGLAVPKLLNRGNPANPTETAVGMYPGENTGETMVGFETPGVEGAQNEGGGQAGAMVGNGMVEVDSLEELSKSIGFSVPEVKKIPFEVSNTVYTNGWNDFAQVAYQGESQTEEVLFRKARGTDDISGDYNAYADVKEVTVNDTAVTLKGENGTCSLAIWQQDGFTYSLSCEPGESEDVFVAMIQSIR